MPLVRRVLDLGLKLLVLGLALLVLAMVGFAWRLSAGPLSLAWLTPRIEQALTPATGVAVEIGTTAARLAPNGYSLELIAKDVRLRRSDGPLLASFDEVEVGLSARAFVQQRIAAVSHVTLFAPSLRLTRRLDGSFGLLPAGAAEAEPGVDLLALVGRFMRPAGDADPLTYLRRVRLADGRMTLRDLATGELMAAEQLTLELQRLMGGLQGSLSANLQQHGRPARLQITAHEVGRSDRIAFETRFADLLLPEFAALAPAWPLAELPLPLRGQVNAEISLAGVLSPVRLAIEGGPGELSLPALPAPVPISALALAATWSPAARQLEVASLRATSEQAVLAGQGRLVLAEAGPSLDAQLSVRDLPVARLGAFWPPDFVPETRSWVTQNITTGQVPKLTAKLQFVPADFAQAPLRDEALDLQFDFSQLSVRYLDEMPAVTGLAGQARMTGQSLHFAINEGLSDRIAVKPGSSVDITGIGQPGRDTTQLEVQAQLAGQIADALRLLGHLEVGRDLEIKPEQTSGQAEVALTIGLPLHSGVTEAETRVAAEAQLAAVGIRKLRGKVDVSDGRLDLVIGADELTLQGEAAVLGLPMRIDLREPLDRGKEAERRLRLRGSVDRAVWQRYAPDLPVRFEGQAAFDATLSETDGVLWVDLAADLAETGLAWDAVAWQKTPGEPGELHAALAVPADGPPRLREFDLATAGLALQGALELDPKDQSLVRLQLRHFQLDNSQGSVMLQRQRDVGYEVSVKADTLDLDRLLLGGQNLGEGSDARFRLGLQANQLYLRGQAFERVTGRLIRAAAGWQDVELNAVLPASGAKVALTLKPEAAGGQRLRLTSDDAGALLVALEQTNRIEGGKLTLTAQILQQQPMLAAHGSLAVDQFTLRQAPVLARLLTLASLTGIGNLLTGKEGIKVDRFRLPFDVQGQKLILDRGQLSGSQLGLTLKGQVDFAAKQLDLDGTIVPFYAINRILGRLPVIGDFLAGQDGLGAFAFTYQVRGPMAEPQIVLNPLSVLAPGAIRDLVNGLVSGGLEPPDMRPTDN